MLICLLVFVALDINNINSLGLNDDAFNVLTHESFMSAIAEEYPLIIMVS